MKTERAAVRRKLVFSRRFSWLLTMVLAVGLALGVWNTQVAHAASLTVDDGACDDVTGSPAYCTIQAAVNAAAAGDTINVLAGTYTLPTTVQVNKANLTISGAGPSTVIQVSLGAPAGHAFNLDADGVTLENLKLQKTDKAGVHNLINVSSNNVTVRNSTISGQYVLGDPDVSRAFEVEGALSGLLIKGNTINGLRQPGYVNASAGTIEENLVSGTRGWVLDNANLTFTNNSWGTGANANYLDIVVIPGTNAAYYPNIVAISDANNNAVVEDQRPTPRLLSDVFVNAAAAAGGDGTVTRPYLTIAEGVTRVAPGGTVNVFPGTYNETSPNSTMYNGVSYQFGLFLGDAKSGVTLQGVKANGTPITDAADVVTTITTNSTNNFGHSGILVEGDDVTISGLGIGNNIPGNNKTIEVIGDNFTLEDSVVDVTDGGSVYINDFRYTAGNSHVESYTLDGNLFKQGTSVDIASGAGHTGAVAGRQITNNTFEAVDAYWALISFNGAGGVDWFTYPVGGAVITGNEFSGSEMHIRARGTYTESDFDWASYWANNTFDRAVVVGSGSDALATLRADSYTSGDYTFTNRRMIGATVQGQVDRALAGDTVLAKAGTYAESVTIDEALTLKGAQANTAVGGRSAGGASESTLQGLLTIVASNVEVNGFTVTNPNNYFGIRVKPVSVGDVNSPRPNNVRLAYNIVDNVGPSPDSTNVKAIYLEGGPDNVTVEYNRISNIAGGTRGADAVFAGDSNSTDPSTGLIVRENTISNITAGRGAYGVALNNGSAAGNTTGGVPGAQVLNNTFSNLSGSWTHAVGMETRTLNAVVTGNTFSGLAATGADKSAIFFEKNPQSNTVTVKSNKFNGNDFYGVALHPTSVTANYTAVAEENWWNSVSGPAGAAMGSGALVGTNVDFSPWWGDALGSFLVAPSTGGGVEPAPGSTDEQVQDLLDSVPTGSTVVLPNTQSGNTPDYTPDGGFQITQPGLTIVFGDGVNINPNSPCFVVSASNTTLATVSPGGATCTPTGNSNGFETGAAVSNLVIRGFNINGTDASGSGDGIRIGHAVTNLQILNNYIHDMDGDGIEYAAAVSGVHEVQGNLISGNAGKAINNGSGSPVNAEYNSWGTQAGPAAGNFTGTVDYTPWTHAALSAAHIAIGTNPASSPVADRVGEGYTIVYTVKLDAQELRGVDFDIAFDKTKLEVVSITNHGLFTPQGTGSCSLSTAAQANTDGVLAFCGNRTAPTSALSGAAQNVLTVVFKGLDAGSVTLNFDEATDAFAMETPGGASNHIYASGLMDKVLEVFNSTAVTGRIDLQGRANDTGAVLTLGTGSGQGYGPFASSASDYWGAFSSTPTVVYDTYGVTIAMSRYLPVTANSGRSVTLSTDNRVLNTIVLLGGNAFPDEVINISDASLIGGEYGRVGAAITNVNADINNDGKVDLLDLVLMGGNFDKTSSTAYGSWTP